MHYHECMLNLVPFRFLFYTLALISSFAHADKGVLANIVQLTFEGNRSGEGYFSSTGSKICYQSENVAGNPFYQIYSLDLVSGENTLISSGVGKTTCAWFYPTEEKILYASTHLDPTSRSKQKEELELRKSGKQKKYSWDYDPNYDLFSKNLITGKISRLTNSYGYDAECAYSPDGKKIVFTSNRHAYDQNNDPATLENPSFHNEIYLMHSSGERVTRLTDHLGYDGGPFFDSTGGNICWRRFSSDGHNAEIYTMNLAKRTENRLTSLQVMSWAPYFHPSNKYIIFSTNIHGFNNFELYIVDSKGQKDPVRVTDREGFDGLPSFSPDGQTISWTSNQTNSGKSQIFLAKWNHGLALEKLSLSELGSHSQHVNTKPSSFPSTVTDISTNDTKLHIDFLTNDNLEGRQTGTKGARLAGEFVAMQFQKIGLEPFINNKWHQEFPFTHSAKIGSQNKLHSDALSKEFLSVETEWNPLSFSESGPLEIQEIVFAGYGIRPKGLVNQSEYDSYTHLDVKDKCVMVLGGLPDSWNEEDKEKLRYEGTFQKKARIARDLKAKAIIFINPEEDDPVSFSKSFANEMISIKSFSLNRDFVRKIFLSNARDFEKVHSKIAKGEPYMGFALSKVTLKGKIDVTREKGNGINTIGMLKGSENKDSKKLIIVGAHLDHIGRGRRSSRAKKTDFGKIHPGADDNASGIAALLEIAEFLCHLKKKGLLVTQHDIVFVAWSGEEIGLIGSSYFVKSLKMSPNNPPNKKVMAYLNMDMIGRLNDKLTLHGIGSSSKWSTFIQKANISVGINLNLQKDSHIPTDTTSFVSKSIPVLSAFTGLHDDYHSPTDTADKINHEGVVKCAELFSKLLVILSAQTEMDFIVQTPPKKRMGALRAYLGTIPNYSQTDIKGVLLSGVTKGGPADKAGLIAEDLVVSLNGVTIENIYDYTDAIGTLKPEVATSIKIIRTDKKVTLNITPLAR